MERVNVGDMFKVKKHFSFCGVSYGVGERFKVISVYSASKARGEFAIYIQDMFNNRRITIGAEVFGRYMRDGYFTKIKMGKEEVDKMDEFKLEVGDIAQTKYSTFTVVKDKAGKFCAVSHGNSSLLRIEDFRIQGIVGDNKIEEVYRHSLVSCTGYGFNENSLGYNTQVYPKPKVKLTLSEIKSKFQIENEEVEIDMEN